MELQLLVKVLAKLEITLQSDWTQMSENRFKMSIDYQAIAIQRYQLINTLLIELDLEHDIEVSVHAHFDTSSLEFLYEIFLCRFSA